VSNAAGMGNVVEILTKFPSEKHKDLASRVLVAQYAVLEANAKVNGRGQFSHPLPSKTPEPISMSCQIYYYVPPRELMCKIWLESIRPLRICACVKKHGLCGFFN